MRINRDRYLDLLKSKRQNGLIKVVTCMRRCGKSYLLFNLFKDYLINEGTREDHIIEIAFDAFENKRFRDPEKTAQEQRPLMQTDDFFKRIITTGDSPAPYYNDCGILIMSVYDFCSTNTASNSDAAPARK